MSRILITLAAVAALALAGCEQKPEGGPTPSAAGTDKTAASAQDDLATEQDFEEEAEKEITAANLDSEVDKLAKEIGE